MTDFHVCSCFFDWCRQYASRCSTVISVSGVEVG